MIDEERFHIIREAARDLRYLLNRGYNKSSSLRLVGDRYRLDKLERLILFRSVYSDRDAGEIRLRRVGESELKGAEIWIDGFNVLHTVEAILRKELLVEGDDGVVRDFSAIHGKYRVGEMTEKALQTIIEMVKLIGITKVMILYESQISRSGEVASLTRRIIQKIGITGEAETSRSVDSKLINSGKILATSDSAILLKCKRFFDLPGHIAYSMGVNVLRL